MLPNALVLFNSSTIHTYLKSFRKKKWYSKRVKFSPYLSNLSPGISTFWLITTQQNHLTETFIHPTRSRAAWIAKLPAHETLNVFQDPKDELTSLSWTVCRNIAPRRAPSWPVELAERRSTWFWAGHRPRRCLPPARASSCRPRTSSDRWRSLTEHRWRRTSFLGDLSLEKGLLTSFSNTEMPL